MKLNENNYLFGLIEMYFQIHIENDCDTYENVEDFVDTYVDGYYLFDLIELDKFCLENDIFISHYETMLLELKTLGYDVNLNRLENFNNYLKEFVVQNKTLLFQFYLEINGHKC